jgi:pimeloyl-ACP methyl ester carboxylesterase
MKDSLDIDPSENHGLVVATPSRPDLESNPDNDVASFRKWTIGAVTHGFSVAGEYQEWVDELASVLHNKQIVGYDATIAYHWEAACVQPVPDTARLAAQGMAAQIVQAIKGIEQAPDFRSNDVIDIHLIGHSRGGGVITQVAGLLARDTAPLQGGFLKLTLLDPHPARNTRVPYYSSSGGPLGQLAEEVYLQFQAVVNDPPVDIPRSVDRTEVFYLHTPVTGLTTSSSFDLRFLNYWGKVPFRTEGDKKAVFYYDLNPLMLSDRSHTGPIAYYFDQVVPTLRQDDPIPIPIPPDNGKPRPPEGGGSDPSTIGIDPGTAGFDYEFAVLTTGGIDPKDADLLLKQLAQFDQYLDRRQSDEAEQVLVSITSYVQQQSGQTIPQPVADGLLAAFKLAQILLISHPSAVGRPRPRP